MKSVFSSRNLVVALTFSLIAGVLDSTSAQEATGKIDKATVDQKIYSINGSSKLFSLFRLSPALEGANGGFLKGQSQLGTASQGKAATWGGKTGDNIFYLSESPLGSLNDQRTLLVAYGQAMDISRPIATWSGAIALDPLTKNLYVGLARAKSNRLCLGIYSVDPSKKQGDGFVPNLEKLKGNDLPLPSVLLSEFIPSGTRIGVGVTNATLIIEGESILFCLTLIDSQSFFRFDLLSQKWTEMALVESIQQGGR